MVSGIRFASLATCLLLLISTAPAEEKPAPSPSPTPEKSKKEEKNSSQGDEFNLPVTEGEPIKGIRIPNYGPDGALQMMLTAEEAKKIDDRHLEFQDLKIDAYSEDGKKIYIELPSAIFNVENRVLDGEDNVLIRREDFEITGKKGQFHLKTRFAKILGDVKMIIYSTDSLNEQ